MAQSIREVNRDLDNPTITDDWHSVVRVPPNVRNGSVFVLGIGKSFGVQATTYATSTILSGFAW
jgi:hypothetical protein